MSSILLLDTSLVTAVNAITTALAPVADIKLAFATFNTEFTAFKVTIDANQTDMTQVSATLTTLVSNVTTLIGNMHTDLTALLNAVTPVSTDLGNIGSDLQTMNTFVSSIVDALANVHFLQNVNDSMTTLATQLTAITPLIGGAPYGSVAQQENYVGNQVSALVTALGDLQNVINTDLSGNLTGIVAQLTAMVAPLTAVGTDVVGVATAVNAVKGDLDTVISEFAGQTLPNIFATLVTAMGTIANDIAGINLSGGSSHDYTTELSAMSSSLAVISGTLLTLQSTMHTDLSSATGGGGGGPGPGGGGGGGSTLGIADIISAIGTTVTAIDNAISLLKDSQYDLTPNSTAAVLLAELQQIAANTATPPTVAGLVSTDGKKLADIIQQNLQIPDPVANPDPQAPGQPLLGAISDNTFSGQFFPGDQGYFTVDGNI